MPAFQTEATVLRHTDFRESDRMVTLFSPTHGRIDALARGCKKPAGTMAMASELFASGTYQIFEKGERMTLIGFSLREGFYPLRTDVERISAACFCLALCLAAVQPNAPDQALYASLQRGLALLAYGDCSERAVVTCFLMSFAACAGFQPELDHCTHCGRPVESHAVYDAQSGGICCSTCIPRAATVSPQTLQWLRTIQREDYAVCAQAPVPAMPVPAMRAPAVDAALKLMCDHIEYHLQGAVKASKYLSFLR